MLEWDEKELQIHNNFVKEMQELSRTKKVILLYNHMNDDSRYPISDGYCLDQTSRKRQEQLCPYSCVFTDEKSVIDFADAVVLSVKNLRRQGKLATCKLGHVAHPLRCNFLFRVDFPPSRRHGQYWILLSMHPPDQIHRDDDPTNLYQYEENFNWTMGYHHESDIWLPYGRILKKSEGKQEDCVECVMNYGKLTRKRKLVAWITTSDCFRERPSSGRNELIRSLARYVPVDIFGNCGPNPCVRHSSNFQCEDVKECYYHVGQSYKFHLAIEDSLCDDYVTEKFFHALEVGMVPIVLGKANYIDIAVPGSFIDVADFSSVQDLVYYMLYLDQNPKEYLKFFRWHHYAYVSPHSHWEMGWCLLCSFLWERSQKNYSAPHGFVDYTKTKYDLVTNEQLKTIFSAEGNCESAFAYGRGRHSNMNITS